MSTKDSSTTPSTRKKAINCHSCKTTYNIKDVGISEGQHNYIKENKVQGYVWLCSLCLVDPRKQIDEFQRNISEKLELIENQNEIKQIKDDLQLYIDQKLQKFEEKLFKKVDKQKDVLNKNIIGIADSVSNNMEKQKEAINKNMNTFADVVAKIPERNNETTTVITSLNKDLTDLKNNIENKMNLENERNIQKTKANNIIVYNIPESQGSDNEAYKNDVLKVKSIFQEKLNLKIEDIKDIHRIAPREKRENRIRPIRIVFNNLEKRMDAFKLRNIVYRDEESSEEKTIFISMDRTKQEQAAHKKLVEEMKERRSKEGKQFYIRNGKIMEFLPFRSSPQQYWG